MHAWRATVLLAKVCEPLDDVVAQLDLRRDAGLQLVDRLATEVESKSHIYSPIQKIRSTSSGRRKSVKLQVRVLRARSHGLTNTAREKLGMAMAGDGLKLLNKGPQARVACLILALQARWRFWARRGTEGPKKFFGPGGPFRPPWKETRLHGMGDTSQKHGGADPRQQALSTLQVGLAENGMNEQTIPGRTCTKK